MSYANPFEPPRLVTSPVSQNNAKLPVFSIVMLIIDLVFRSIRFLVVLLGIVGLAVLKDEPDMFFYGILEVITGAMMFLFGGIGDVLVLMKKRVGIYLCWIGVAATIANLGVGILELPLQLQRGAFANPGAQDVEMLKTVAYTAAILTILFRLILTILYGIAVHMAGKALKK
jgi:hypothetical protein